MRYYSALPNLPSIPQHLLQHDFTRTEYEIVSDILLHRGSDVFQGGRYFKNPIDPELAKWIAHNIVSEWSRAVFTSTSAPCLGPHMDCTRIFTLAYVIDPGGPAVDTVFYEAANEKLEILNRMKVDRYDDIKAVDSYRAPAHSWWLIDGRHIHSVENIQTARTSVQIGLMRDPLANDLLLS